MPPISSLYLIDLDVIVGTRGPGRGVDKINLALGRIGRHHRRARRLDCRDRAAGAQIGGTVATVTGAGKGTAALLLSSGPRDEAHRERAGGGDQLAPDRTLALIVMIWPLSGTSMSVVRLARTSSRWCPSALRYARPACRSASRWSGRPAGRAVWAYWRKWRYTSGRRRRWRPWPAPRRKPSPPPRAARYRNRR